MKITIEGRVIQHTEAKIFKSMDTGADSITVTFPWLHGKDQALDDIVKPLRDPLPEFEAEIDGELLVSGKIYIPKPELTVTGSTNTLEGFSYTKDLIDSNAKPPYQFIKKSLLDMAVGFCTPFGIAAFEENVAKEVDELFDDESIEPTEKIFDFIKKLAWQRGVLVSSDEDGNLLFLKTTTNKVPVENITEGDLQGANQAGQIFSAIFDATKIFNTYKALRNGPDTATDPSSAISKDKNVSSPRFLTFSADESTKGNIQQAADWARNKSLADALTIPFPVVGFKTPSGKLRRENTFTTVTSPTISIPNGFDFLIRSIEYTSAENSETAVLNLVPPQLYTKEDIVLPW